MLYVVLHRTAIFYICICLWQMFWRNTFYFIFLGIHEVHLDPHRNIQSTILCPATTLCFISRMFCDYVTSCVEARHNHDRSNFGANVGQIKQSLSTCGDNYTYRAEVVLGRNPWFWRKWSTLERSSTLLLTVSSISYIFNTTTASSGPEGLYVNTLQFLDIFWYRYDVEEFLSWKWWLWRVLVQTLQSGLHHLGQSSYLHKHLSIINNGWYRAS